MNNRLVRIGSSRGVQLPKPRSLDGGLAEEVELRVQERAIVIARAALPRSGWAEAARSVRMGGEDTLLDPPTPIRFDETEWKW
jgi:antitoxin component of MazEF toxin-antitoxin module